MLEDFVVVADNFDFNGIAYDPYGNNSKVRLSNVLTNDVQSNDIPTLYSPSDCDNISTILFQANNDSNLSSPQRRNKASTKDNSSSDKVSTSTKKVINTRKTILDF